MYLLDAIKRTYFSFFMTSLYCIVKKRNCYFLLRRLKINEGAKAV